MSDANEKITDQVILKIAEDVKPASRGDRTLNCGAIQNYSYSAGMC